MRIDELKNLHEEEQALELLSIILDSTAQAFTRHQMLPMSAFFITQRHPDTGQIHEAVVEAFNPKDPAILLDPEKFAHFVGAMAQRTLSIGVLQAFESYTVEKHDGLTSDDGINELFGEDFDKVTDGETVHEEMQPVVTVTFEHLVFSPMTRVWMAPVMESNGKKTLGEWTEETGEGVSSGPMTSYLTFFA